MGVRVPRPPPLAYPGNSFHSPGIDRTMKKPIYFILGWISLFVGAVGAVLPLLPTTPFMLLSAWLFAKSSRRYHRWLRQNRFFGKTIRAWEAKLGLTVREKARLVISATVVIAISFILCPNTVGRIVLVVAWPIPIAVALFTKTRREDELIRDE